MIALTASAVLSVGFVTERSARRALAAEMEERLVLQVRHLGMVSSGALLSDLPEWTLLPLIQQMRARQADLVFVDVVDRAGVIRADRDARALGSRFQPPAGLVREPETPALQPNEELLGTPGLLVASARIEDSQGHVLGTVWIGLRRAAITHRLEAARRSQLAVLAFFLVLGTAGSLVLSSVLLRPIGALRAGLERIGRGDLDTPLEIRGRSEIGALAETVNRMASELRTAQSEMVERERMAHEVQLAQRIQRSLLPPGRRTAGAFVIEGEQRQAAEVGGDYFQILDLPEGRIGLAVADVSGKGLAGSLVTAMLHALLRATAQAHASPAALLSALDRQLGAMLERGSFVTMFYGVLDPADGALCFASAGHNPLLVLHASGEAEWAAAKGPPLAALRGAKTVARYTDVTLRSRPGDVWVQYTDGISEAFQPGSDASFGLDRLARAAEPVRRAGSHAVLEAITAAVTEWRGGAPAHDDDTLLVISRELDGAASGGAQIEPDRASGVEGLEWLRQASRDGRRLSLPATLPALRRIDEWIRETPALSHLGEPEAGLLRLALHEACSNVAEHACGLDPAQAFDLWWVPDGGTNGNGHVSGAFLLRDHGKPFRFEEWTPPDPAREEVRKKGRGFGVEIVRRVMSEVAYRTVASEGNLTRMRFTSRHSQEAPHGYND